MSLDWAIVKRPKRSDRLVYFWPTVL